MVGRILMILSADPREISNVTGVVQKSVKFFSSSICGGAPKLKDMRYGLVDPVSLVWLMGLVGLVGFSFHKQIQTLHFPTFSQIRMPSNT